MGKRRHNIQERIEELENYNAGHVDLGKKWRRRSIGSNVQSSSATKWKCTLQCSLSKLADTTKSAIHRTTHRATYARELILAIRHEDYERVRHILEAHPVDVNECNTKGVSPLHEAAIDGHTDIVQLLLKHNALINQADKDGLTSRLRSIWGSFRVCHISYRK